MWIVITPSSHMATLIYSAFFIAVYYTACESHLHLFSAPVQSSQNGQSSERPLGGRHESQRGRMLGKVCTWFFEDGVTSSCFSQTSVRRLPTFTFPRISKVCKHNIGSLINVGLWKQNLCYSEGSKVEYDKKTTTLKLKKEEKCIQEWKTTCDWKSIFRF